MKPSTQSTPIACAHAASASVSSPTPAIKQATAARVAQRGLNVRRRSIDACEVLAAPSKRARELEAEQEPERGKDDRAADQHRR